MTQLVEELLDWTDPIQVRGGRTTQRAEATDEFWDLWRDHKDELRDLGLRVSRDDDSGVFTVAWIRDPTTEGKVDEAAPTIGTVTRFLKCPPGEASLLPHLYPDQRDALWTLKSAFEASVPFTLDASDPGMGKTWIALQLMRDTGWNFGVVCPANVVTKWADTAAGAPFHLEPEFVLSYDKLRTGKTDYVSRHSKGMKRKITRFEWELQDRVALVFDEVHMCAGEKSLNSKLLKAAIENPLAYVHGMSATTADSPLDLNAVGQGLQLHDGREFWKWCQRVGCKRGHFGGLTFSTGDGAREPTLNQRRARAALAKIQGHIFPARGCRITVADSAQCRPKNQVFAELVDVDEKHPWVKDALAAVDAKEEADYDRADEKEQAISALTLNTRDRQRAELLKLPSMAERTQHLRAAGNSVVAFLNYSQSIDLLLDLITTDECVVIRGGLSDRDRREAMRRFQDNEVRVCICQIDTGAQSIDLDDQRGGFPRCSLISPGYDAKKLYQALGRPYRPASTKSAVRQWLLFAVGTVEERIGRLVQAKLNGQAMLNDADIRAAVQILPKK